jgi:hypothetical protein
MKAVVDLIPDILDGTETKVNAGTNVSVTGNGTVNTPYIINSTDTNTTYSAGTGLSLVGTTFNNTSPDQAVTLTQGTDTVITGTYPNFTISSNAWIRGDTKEIVCDDTYRITYFDSTGLGRLERTGWAIMNGATHIFNGSPVTVPNDNGRVVVAYGTNYPTLGATGGSKDAVVVKHSHVFRPTGATYGENTTAYYNVFMASAGDAYNNGNQYKSTDDTGESGTDKNMQPYVVRLRIMKL